MVMSRKGGKKRGRERNREKRERGKTVRPFDDGAGKVTLSDFGVIEGAEGNFEKKKNLELLFDCRKA